MRIFVVSRSQDTAPFAVLDAPDAEMAIGVIKDMNELGELLCSGYWGSEDEDGYRAEIGSDQQVADWTANHVHGMARGDLTIIGKRPGDVDRVPGTTQYIMFIAKPDLPPSR